MELFSIEVSANGDTLWVTGDDGPCLGRFSKRWGMDVHRSVAEQMAGADQCLHCTHTPADEETWIKFCKLVRQHFGIHVPIDAIRFNPHEARK